MREREGKVFLGERPLLQGIEGCVRVLWLGQPDPRLLTCFSIPPPSSKSPEEVLRLEVCPETGRNFTSSRKVGPRAGILPGNLR